MSGVDDIPQTFHGIRRVRYDLSQDIAWQRMKLDAEDERQRLASVHAAVLAEEQTPAGPRAPTVPTVAGTLGDPFDTLKN